MKRELVSGWEDALQCDAEVEGKVRLHVLVSLPAADAGDCRGKDRRQVRRGPVNPTGCLREEVSVESRDARSGLGGLECMGVRRHFRNRNRMRLLAAAFAQA